MRWVREEKRGGEQEVKGRRKRSEGRGSKRRRKRRDGRRGGGGERRRGEEKRVYVGCYSSPRRAAATDPSSRTSERKSWHPSDARLLPRELPPRRPWRRETLVLAPSSPSSPQRFPHASKFPLYFLICLLTKPYRLNPLLYPPLSFFLCRFFVSFFIYSFRVSTSKSWKMYKSRPVHTFFISSSWIWGGPNDRHINPLWLFSSRSSRCQTHWASLRRYESDKKIRLDNDKGIYTSIAYGLW